MAIPSKKQNEIYALMLAVNPNGLFLMDDTVDHRAIEYDINYVNKRIIFSTVDEKLAERIETEYKHKKNFRTFMMKIGYLYKVAVWTVNRD